MERCALPRSRCRFHLDDLYIAALGMLDREGEGPTAVYFNTPDGAAFLAKDSPAYVGGLLQMLGNRLYKCVLV